MWHLCIRCHIKCVVFKHYGTLSFKLPSHHAYDYRRSQRTDWRTERKLNSETFGVASTRRGSYRGRGGFYQGGRGMYRNYRGGYNRGQGGRPVPRPNYPVTTQNTMPVSYTHLDVYKRQAIQVRVSSLYLPNNCIKWCAS